MAGASLLHIALERNDTLSTIEALVEDGASVHAFDTRGEPLLVRAVRAGRADIVDFLLRAGCNVHAQTHPACLTALHVAADLGDLDAIRLLLRARASCSMRSAAGLTPIAEARRDANALRLMLAAAEEELLAAPAAELGALADAT
ncbi:hypothetical protein KFE25_009954 [Diacronema lutheri]|uniref:Ankyrin repeat domain-containing protein n=1 Tax=Diacronema lutheri TaxID=2081491 RepID=A0A8J6CAY8_DIALT|nr:hypothetical protein KFE25_009954 [Diacronema lutheri]